MTKLEDLFSELNKSHVRYMVAGGVAVNLYGIERATADIDLVIDLHEINIRKFVAVSKRLGFMPKMPVRLEDLIVPEKREEWAREKGMVVFSIFDPRTPFFLLDVFIRPPFDFSEAYKGRHIMKSGRTTIPVVSPDVLIGMKKDTGRPQDKADVYYLKKIMKEWKR